MLKDPNIIFLMFHIAGNTLKKWDLVDKYFSRLQVSQTLFPNFYFFNQNVKYQEN